MTLREHFHLSHAIGHHPTFAALRKKYYSDAPELSVQDENSQTPLVEFTLLREQEGRLPIRVITPPASYASPSILNMDSMTSDQWRQIVAALKSPTAPRWDLCRFRMLTAAQTDLLTFRLIRAGLPYSVTTSSFWVISGGRTWKQYLDSRRSSFNRNQNRCIRNMEAQGFSFNTELKLDSIFDVFEKRSAVKGEGDYSITPAFKGFLTELRDAFIQEGRWYEIGIEKEGKLHAFTLGFWDDEKVFYAFQTCYDPEFHSLRLGALTFERLIENALSNGCKYISFMGDSGYFSSFTDEAYLFHNIDIFSPTPKGLAVWAQREGGKRLRISKHYVQVLKTDLERYRPKLDALKGKVFRFALSAEPGAGP